MTLIEFWTKQAIWFGFIKQFRARRILINVADIKRIEPESDITRTKVVCSDVTYEIDETYDEVFKRIGSYSMDGRLTNIPIIKLTNK